MLEQVVKKNNLIDKLIEEDKKVLIFLIYDHISLYESFKLNMDKKLLYIQYIWDCIIKKISAKLMVKKISKLMSLQNSNYNYIQDVFRFIRKELNIKVTTKPKQLP